MTIVETLALSLVGLSCALYLLVLLTFTVHWILRPAPASLPARPPSVSILKPVCGADDDLRSNLESFAKLDYPVYELLLGVASHYDLALPTLRAFAADHPELPIRVLVTESSLALNPKVAQLASLTGVAVGSVLVVSDSNVRVRPDWLRGLVAELSRPGVGLVSNAIVGEGEKTLGACVENAHMTAHILPLVVALWKLLGRAVTIGKSMAFRRADFEQLGGWDTVSGVLAEDDVLGRKFHAAGHEVRIVLDPVENTNSICSILRTYERHSRWARIHRAMDPAALAVQGLLSPTWMALAGAMLAPGKETATAWVLATALQWTGTIACLTLVRRALPPVRLMLAEWVRPYVALCCWMSGWASRRVSWRGHDFALARGSRLVALSQTAEPQAGRGWASL